MIYDEDDEIISVDMYLKQQNFEDVIYDEDEIDTHIIHFNTPTIVPKHLRTPRSYDTCEAEDNAHIVFRFDMSFSKWYTQEDRVHDTWD
jgi:hypothetical protein